MVFNLAAAILLGNFLNTINELKFDINFLKAEQEVLLDIKDIFIPIKVEATGYAPLDPNAIEGVCYSGDPRITSSGNPSNPSRSVAMGRNFPFGTEIYIPGLGYRIVEDRGGAIGNSQLDIMFLTQKEALGFGRQKDFLIFVNPNSIKK